MAKLKHVVVANTLRQAASYAFKSGWNLHDWVWVDSALKLKGITDVTVYFIKDTLPMGRAIDIMDELMFMCQTNNVAVVEVVL